MKRVAAALAAWWALAAISPLPPPNDALIRSDALPERISELRLIAGGGRTPHPGVEAYGLNTPLFSDYAEKWRWLYVPKGAKLRWQGDGLPDFPVGSVLIKSFGYPADMRRPADNIRLLETRLLIRRAAGWIALPYVWNSDGSDAVLKRAGTRIDVGWTHSDGTARAISYAVPNVNQCKGCHDDGGKLSPIGPAARNIAPSAGFLKRWGAGRPAMRIPRWDDASAPVALRARAYLDVNCGHCHRPSGPANTSGLWLNWDQPSGPNLGMLKRPTAAGRGSGNLAFAIAPGQPQASYLVYRMESLDPGIAMPELGRATVHSEGVALVSQWIAEMK